MFLLCSQFLNATNNIGRHREDRELSTREFTTCYKAKKLVSALNVTKRTEAGNTSGTRGHGVDRCVLFMNLCIRDERKTTVRFVVYCHASENGTGTKCWR